MADPRGGDVPLNQAAHPVPAEAMFVAAALEHLVPQSIHLLAGTNQGNQSGDGEPIRGRCHFVESNSPTT
jgi:hypothetical protein